MTHFNRFRIGIDDPGNLRAAREKVFEPFVDFGSSVIGRQDFHREVGGSGENFRVDRLKPMRASRSLLTNEISGARQLRVSIQNPVLESQTAPS